MVKIRAKPEKAGNMSKNNKEQKKSQNQNAEAENLSVETEVDSSEKANDKNVETAENGKVAELETKLSKVLKAADEYKASWYRTAADFDNYKKRNNETRANAYADGKGDVIKSILVIGDNLDRALALAIDEKTREGMELVVRQFAETLKNLGVSEINPVGETFDPNVHEAVHQVEPEDGDQSGTIKQVFKKGYSLNGKMLRYAQVVVIK